MAGTIDQLIKLSGAQQVKSELTAIGKEGEKAFSGIEKSAQSASGGIAKVGEAAAGAARAGGALNSILAGAAGGLAAGAFTEIAKSLQQLATSYFTAAAAAAKFVTEQQAAAQRAGQTTKNLAESTGALKLFGLTAGETQQVIDKFGASAVESLDAVRADLKKKGITFAPGAAGDAAMTKYMGNLGGLSGKVNDFVTLMKASKGAVDPLTGALKVNEDALANYAESIKKIESPLERIKEITKVTKDEGLARRLEPIFAGGGAAVRAQFEDVRKLTGGKTEAQIQARDKDAKSFKEALDRLGTATGEVKTDLGIEAAKGLTPLTNALATATPEIGKFVTEYGKLIALAPFQPMIVGGDALRATVATGAQVIGFLTNATEQVLGLKTKAEETKTSIDQIGTSAPDFSGLVEAAKAAFEKIIEGALKTRDALKQILPGGGGAPALVPSGPGEMASGGSVRGPGSGTSDSILARLSNGEYVVKAAAVRHYGAGMLAAINSMRFAKGGPVPGFAAGGQAGQAQQQLLQTAVTAGLAAADATNKAMQEHHKKISEILNNLLQAFTGGIGGLSIGYGAGPGNLRRGFSMGGLVGALSPMVPGLAGGGLVPAPSQSRSLHPVTISLPGGNNVSGLTAPPSVVDRLEREVLLKSPAGRAPSWRGR